MAYPPYLARITHFSFDANAGLDSPSPVGVDSELSGILASMNQMNGLLRGITSPDGRLKNLALATAQALAGTQDITATASQADFVTTIAWQSSFTTSNVFVFIAGAKIAPVSVQDDGTGVLEVTLAAQSAGVVVTIAAFESGAGILTRLATAGSATDGANLVSIRDVGAYTTTITVEEALQELYGHTQGASGKAWIEGVAALSDYLKKSGGTMTGDVTFSGGTTVKGLRAAAANGEAVRYEQFITLQTTLTGITSTFMPKSGGTFTGPVSFNLQTLSGVPVPTNSDHPASKGYVDTTLASFGGLPVGTVIDFAAASVPTGWLSCDGAAVSRTTYAALFAVIGTVWGPGDAATTFNLPDLRGRTTVGSGTGTSLSPRALAAVGGAETHTLATSEIPSHLHTGWGGAQTTSSPPAALPDMTFSAGNRGPADSDTGLTGGGGAHNNMQPFSVATKIIKF